MPEKRTALRPPVMPFGRKFLGDWVLRTSGVLPTKPTRVTVFFMMIVPSKLFKPSKGPSPFDAACGVAQDRL